jgi:hypothetical protein
MHRHNLIEQGPIGMFLLRVANGKNAVALDVLPDQPAFHESNVRRLVRLIEEHGERCHVKPRRGFRNAIIAESSRKGPPAGVASLTLKSRPSKLIPAVLQALTTGFANINNAVRQRIDDSWRRRVEPPQQIDAGPLTILDCITVGPGRPGLEFGKIHLGIIAATASHISNSAGALRTPSRLVAPVGARCGRRAGLASEATNEML